MSEEKELSALELLKQVIALMEEHELAEVRLSESGIKVHVKRQGDELLSFTHPQTLVQPTTQPEALPYQESQDHSLDVIKSPMLGTFYRSPQPDQPSFVEEGSRVTAGDTLCLIEAMKVYTDLKAEFDCEIVDILVEDSQPVEYDQSLFRVRKL